MASATSGLSSCKAIEANLFDVPGSFFRPQSSHDADQPGDFLLVAVGCAVSHLHLLEAPQPCHSAARESIARFLAIRARED